MCGERPRRKERVGTEQKRGRVLLFKGQCGEATHCIVRVVATEQKAEGAEAVSLRGELPQTGIGAAGAGACEPETLRSARP